MEDKIEENLAIASTIMKNDNRKAYDNYCKSVLSNKQILAHILKACVLEFKDIPLEEIPQCIERTSVAVPHSTIQGKPTEDESIPGAQIKYDILFEVSLPQKEGTNKKEVIEMFINLEAQNKENLHYPLISRALYYCSRLLAKQKNAPDGFQKSGYGNLKKVYSIWICMEHACKRNDVINLYTLNEICMNKEWHAPKENYDLMSAIMIYPGRKYKHDDSKHSLLEMLNILFISEISAEDKILRLSKSYGIHMTQKIEKEVDEMCNLSQGIRDRGIAEGISIGMADGITKGIAVMKLMQQSNISVEEVMNMLDVSEDMRSIILKSIEADEK